VLLARVGCWAICWHLLTVINRNIIKSLNSSHKSHSFNTSNHFFQSFSSNVHAHTKLINLISTTLIRHLQNPIELSYKTLNRTLWKAVMASSGYHPVSGWKSACTLSRRRCSLGSGRAHSQPHYHFRCQSFSSLLYQVLILQSLPKWRSLKFAYISTTLTVNLVPLLFLMLHRNKKTEPQT